MASTLVSVLVHFVFSTKNRLPLITPELESSLHRYLNVVFENHGCRLLAIGGTTDHVHLLVSMGKTWSLVDLMAMVKHDSSMWAKRQGQAFSEFYWQEGYGAFSIGQSAVPALKTYIVNQKQHHQRRTFQDEFRAMLRKYQIPFDERYVWG